MRVYLLNDRCSILLGCTTANRDFLRLFGLILKVSNPRFLLHIFSKPYIVDVASQNQLEEGVQWDEEM